MPAAELLDVVTDDDAVRFPLPRDQVHREYQIHRSVMFFVFDDEGRVFVNQRSATKEIYPSFWSIAFGGHVLAGESYDTAVVREVLEETGLSTPPSFIAAFKKRTGDERENVRVYGVVADGDLRLFEEEIEQGRFVSVAELTRLLSRFDFLPETERLLHILVEHTARKSE